MINPRGFTAFVAIEKLVRPASNVRLRSNEFEVVNQKQVALQILRQKKDPKTCDGGVKALDFGHFVAALIIFGYE